MASSVNSILKKLDTLLEEQLVDCEKEYRLHSDWIKETVASTKKFGFKRAGGLVCPPSTRKTKKQRTALRSLSPNTVNTCESEKRQLDFNFDPKDEENFSPAIENRQNPNFEKVAAVAVDPVKTKTSPVPCVAAPKLSENEHDGSVHNRTDVLPHWSLDPSEVLDDMDVAMEISDNEAELAAIAGVEHLSPINSVPRPHVQHTPDSNEVVDTGENGVISTNACATDGDHAGSEHSMSHTEKLETGSARTTTLSMSSSSQASLENDPLSVSKVEALDASTSSLISATASVSNGLSSSTSNSGRSSSSRRSSASSAKSRAPEAPTEAPSSADIAIEKSQAVSAADSSQAPTNDSSLQASLAADVAHADLASPDKDMANTVAAAETSTVSASDDFFTSLTKGPCASAETSYESFKMPEEEPCDAGLVDDTPTGSPAVSKDATTPTMTSAPRVIEGGDAGANLRPRGLLQNLCASVASFLPLGGKGGVPQLPPGEQNMSVPASGRRSVRVPALEKAEALRKQQENKRKEELRRKNEVTDKLKRAEAKRRLLADQMRKEREEKRKRLEEHEVRSRQMLAKKQEEERRKREDLRKKLAVAAKIREEEDVKRRRHLNDKIEAKISAPYQKVGSQKSQTSVGTKGQQPSHPHTAGNTSTCSASSVGRTPEKTREQIEEESEKMPPPPPRTPCTPNTPERATTQNNESAPRSGDRKVVTQLNSPDGYPLTDPPSDFNCSDSDSDDDHRKGKRIPPWARDPTLLASLLHMQEQNPDNIFGPVKACDLKEIFANTGAAKKKYTRRTSSAHWITNDKHATP